MMASTTSDANVIPHYVAATAAIKKNIPAALLTEIRFFFAIGFLLKYDLSAAAQ